MALVKELGRHYASWVTLNQASFVTAFYVETISWSCGDRSWGISLLRGGFRGKEPLFVFVLRFAAVYAGWGEVGVDDGWTGVCVGDGDVLLPSVVAQAGSLLKLVFDTPFCVCFFLWDSFTHAPRTSPFYFYLCGPFSLSLVSCLMLLVC